MWNSQDFLHFDVRQMNRLLRQFNLTIRQPGKKIQYRPKLTFTTHGGSDLEDAFFTTFLVFSFGVGADEVVASELNRSKVKCRYRSKV